MSAQARVDLDLTSQSSLTPLKLNPPAHAEVLVHDFSPGCFLHFSVHCFGERVLLDLDLTRKHLRHEMWLESFCI